MVAPSHGRGSMAIYGCYLLLSQCLLAALGPVPSFFESSVAHLHRDQLKGNQRDEVQHEPSPDNAPSKALIDIDQLIPSPISPIRIMSILSLSILSLHKFSYLMLFAYLLHWILDKVTQKQFEESDEDMMRTLHFSPNMKMLQVVIASCCKVSSNSER